MIATGERPASALLLTLFRVRNAPEERPDWPAAAEDQQCTGHFFCGRRFSCRPLPARARGDHGCFQSVIQRGGGITTTLPIAAVGRAAA